MSARVPKYCHHKKTGQGFVKLNGRFIYLGEYDTPDSRQRYDALIAEWLACGRMTHENAPFGLSITQLIVAFVKH